MTQTEKWYKQWWIWFPIISISVAVITIIVVLLPDNSYKSDKEAFADIFGVYTEGNTSGITGYDVADGMTKAAYNLYPVGIGDLDEEIGIDLAAKFKELYKERSDIDKVEFHVSLPVRDDYGNQEWVHYLAFRMDRDLITNKIKWDNFYSQDFLNVVYDLKKYQ